MPLRLVLVVAAWKIEAERNEGYFRSLAWIPVAIQRVERRKELLQPFAIDRTIAAVVQLINEFVPPRVCARQGTSCTDVLVRFPHEVEFDVKITSNASRPKIELKAGRTSVTRRPLQARPGHLP